MHWWYWLDTGWNEPEFMYSGLLDVAMRACVRRTRTRIGARFNQPLSTSYAIDPSWIHLQTHLMPEVRAS